jgi:hypothetical protein
MAQVEKLDTSKIDIVFLNNVDMALPPKSVDAIAPGSRSLAAGIKGWSRSSSEGKYLQSRLRDVRH